MNNYPKEMTITVYDDKEYHLINTLQKLYSDRAKRQNKSCEKALKNTKLANIAVKHLSDDKVKILNFSNVLPKDKLNSQYFTEFPYFFLANNGALIHVVDKDLEKFTICVGDVYTIKHFNHIVNIMKKAGERLVYINKHFSDKVVYEPDNFKKDTIFKFKKYETFYI